MITEVEVSGRRVRVDPATAVGKGGEAEVFNLGDGTVLKLWKAEDHPDHASAPDPVHARKAAAARLKEQAKKLPALIARASSLPSSMVAPLAAAFDRTGKIAGYTMPFLAGGEVIYSFGTRAYRDAATDPAVLTASAINMLRQLYAATAAVHGAGVVIGDFNDLNGLVIGDKVFLIDADSAQFDAFKCLTYTTTFVDPLNCDPGAKAPHLVRPHGVDSDWYAFTIMLMQTLLFVGPYGGIFKPTDPTKRVLQGRRPLVRATIFGPDIRYPAPAIPLDRLPDELLHHLEAVFMRDQRGVFPARLLERLRWTACLGCGTDHGKATCPVCSKQAPAALKTTTQVRGQVTAERIFPSGSQSCARIVRAEVQNGRLLWLYQEKGGTLKRESGAAVGAIPIDPSLRFWLSPEDTFIGRGGAVAALSTGRLPDARYSVETVGKKPVFGFGGGSAVWAHGGILYYDKGSRNDTPERIGAVLPGQTLLWVGPTFGFGYCPYAGTLGLSFVFDNAPGALNDSVQIAGITGTFRDATCAFTKERVWFLTSSKEGADIVNRCTVIRRDGTVEATAQAIHGDGSWLGQIRGAAATAHVLLMPSDEGIKQAKIEGGAIVESASFPDTEKFVNSTTKLCVATDGLYAVNHKSIVKLTIAKKA